MRLRPASLLATLIAVLGGWSQSCDTNDVVLLDVPARTAGAASGAAGTPSQGGAAAVSGIAGIAGVGAGGSGGTGGNTVVAGGSPAGGTPSAGSGGGALGGRGNGTAGFGGARPCKIDRDCEQSWHCAKDDCLVEFGTCEPEAAVFCPAEPLPVCGCNTRITYWNECLASQSGEFVTSRGECRERAATCRSASDCGVAGAYCARLLLPPEPCDPSKPGKCWVMPPTCQAQQEPAGWVECPPPNPDQPPTCSNTCGAILSESPQIRPPREFCQ